MLPTLRRMQAEAAGHTHARSFAGSSEDGVRALKIGVAGLALTTLFQAVLLFYSGSVALLGDTLHNGVDVAATAVVWVAFLITGRDRSARFSYGFHRIEDLAGLVVVALIAGGALLVLLESMMAFGDEVDVARPWLVLVAGVVGFAGNEGVAQFKIRTGRRIQSAALVADGQHSRADGLTSLGVVAAAVGLLLGTHWLDATVGLVIGLVIAWTAFESGREVLYRLLDHADPFLLVQLEHIAAEFESIDHVNELRVRQLGRTVHVVANVCLPADFPFVRAHDVTEQLRQRWLEVLPPGSIADIHADPFSPDEGPVHAAHAHTTPG